MSARLLLALTSLLLLLALPVRAEQAIKFGDYEAHFVAFNSTFLPAQAARSYGISRSRYNAILNVSVLNITQDPKLAVPVEIEGEAKNLLGNRKRLNFREIKEGIALYYLAEVSFSNEETFQFTIKVTPQDGPSETIKFTQTFYSD